MIGTSFLWAVHRAVPKRIAMIDVNYPRALFSSTPSSAPYTAISSNRETFSQAMERFRQDRENKLRSTLHILERVKEKEFKGIPPRRLENLVSELDASRRRQQIISLPEDPLTSTNKNKSMAIENDIEAILSVRQPVDRLQKRKRQQSIVRNASPITSIQLVQYFERTDSFRVQIMVPQSSISMLIGSHAWRVRKLGLDSQCVVSVVDPLRMQAENKTGFIESKRLSSPYVQLLGNETQIRSAYELLMGTVDSILNYQSDANPVREVRIPSRLPPYPVNNPNQFDDVVRTVKKLSGVFARKGPSSIALWGMEEQVELATRILNLFENDQLLLIKAMYNGEGDTNPSQFAQKIEAYYIQVYRRIPQGMAPILMGSNLNTVRRMRLDTGADIKYADDDDAVTLHGSPNQVLAVWAELDAFIVEFENFTNNINWRKQVALRDRKEMQMLIGKGFSGIRRLQQVTGCLVKVSDIKDPSLTVRLWGRPDQVDHAIKSMFAVLKYGSASIS